MRFRVWATLVLVLSLAACGGQAQSAASAPASAASSPAAANASPTAGGTSSAAASASGKLIHINVAYPQATVTSGPLYVAQDHGIFAGNGLNVTLTQIGGTTQIASLLAGELQIAGTGANEVAHADFGGASIVMVASAIDYPIFSIYANKKYKSMKDLVGQTIGITQAGASSDAAAQLFLKHFSLTGKVKIAPVGGTQASILAAMTTGQIAAGTLVPPVTEKAAKAGFVELVNGINLGVPMNTTGIAVTRAYVKDHPNTLKRFMKAYQEAWTYCGTASNEAEVVKSLSKWTKAPPPLALVGYKAMYKVWHGVTVPTVNPAAVSNLLKLSPEAKARTADPNQFIDNAPLQSVQ
ncbi:MAG TPA: ABC transporter substrate-binding protein [Chloroflexota bacterium]|nr:ABC transporter substrate-binding protein [Chloroflexota bacterium]